MDIIALNQGNIYLTNQMVNASYNYTSLEIDLMARVIKATISLKSDKMTLNLSDLVDPTNGTGSKYDNLRTAFKGLLSKPVEVFNKETNRYYGSNIIASYDIEKYSGMVEIEMSPKMMQLIIGSKMEYTVIELDTLLRLKGKYSKRLYILAAQFIKTGIRHMDIDDLRKQLKIPKDMYPQFADLKKRVIVPALEEINAMSEVQIGFDEIKLGRKVNRISLHIKHLSRSNHNLQYGETNVFESEVDKQQKESLRKWKLTEWQIENIKQVIPVDELHQILYKLSLQRTEIKNPGGYLFKLFSNLGVPMDRAIAA